MGIIGLQVILILIALTEWIFMKSTVVFRGLVEEWELPAGLEAAGSLVTLGIILACYLGESLIYRKEPEGAGATVLRRRGVLWVFAFYFPYLLYSIAGSWIFLFRENGRAEGALLFLVKLLIFISMGVKLYKMPKEHASD